MWHSFMSLCGVRCVWGGVCACVGVGVWHSGSLCHLLGAFWVLRALRGCDGSIGAGPLGRVAGCVFDLFAAFAVLPASPP